MQQAPTAWAPFTPARPRHSALSTAVLGPPTTTRRHLRARRKVNSQWSFSTVTRSCVPNHLAEPHHSIAKTMCSRTRVRSYCFLVSRPVSPARRTWTHRSILVLTSAWMSMPPTRCPSRPIPVRKASSCVLSRNPCISLLVGRLATSCAALISVPRQDSRWRPRPALKRSPICPAIPTPKSSLWKPNRH